MNDHNSIKSSQYIFYYYLLLFSYYLLNTGCQKSTVMEWSIGQMSVRIKHYIMCLNKCEKKYWG